MDDNIYLTGNETKERLQSGDFVMITKRQKDTNLNDWWEEKMFKILQVVEDDNVLMVIDNSRPNVALFKANDPEVLLTRVEVEITLRDSNG